MKFMQMLAQDALISGKVDQLAISFSASRLLSGRDRERYIYIQNLIQLQHSITPATVAHVCAIHVASCHTKF